MSINVIKEGNLLRVLESSEPIPDGARLTLYTASELADLARQPSAWEAAQMESAFSDGEEDWGSSLDRLVIKESN